MRHVSVLCLAMLLVTMSGNGSTSAWSQQPANPAVDAIFADLIQPGAPGCAVGIYRDGQIIYANGYGLANIEENVRITPETVFDIASVAKQFVAASVLLLERQGKLRLDDDVRKYFPQLPDYDAGRRKITILDLLSHISGLRDYPSLFLLSGIHADNVTTDRDALEGIVRQTNLNFRPGTSWQYGNSGYLLLSLIVKQASGKDLKTFAADNIFQPLGMAHTQFRIDHTALIPKRALAYAPADNSGYTLDVPYFEEASMGQLHTSIEDLQKWDENFYSGTVGGLKFATEMEQQCPTQKDCLSATIEACAPSGTAVPLADIEPTICDFLQNTFRWRVSVIVQAWIARDVCERLQSCISLRR
jgi:CubicO group peptidase (beta-lactamase class C family)